MSENIFTYGKSFGNQDHRSVLEDYIKRSEDARRSYGFEKNSIIPIDELPTATTVKAVPKPIDHIFHPDPDNRFWGAYIKDDLDDLVTPDAIDYFKKNPSVTSVDFNVSYPGYTDYDYHPIRYSDPTEGFTSQFNEFSKRHPVFAESLKDRIKSVNEVIDANPDKFNPSGFVDDKAYYYPDDSGVKQDAATRRINFTPEDSKRLSKSLNEDLTDMFKGAPPGTTFVNNPDTPSRGKLYTRFANFSPVDEAGNQFVVTGPRGSLQSLQITDPDLPALGPSNFDTNPSFGRTIREMIDPDSVDEIRKLPAFQRSLYQKPSVKDLTRSATRFASQVKLPKVPGVRAGTGAVLGDIAVGGAMSYLTGETDDPKVAGWAGVTGLIPQSTNTAMGTMPMTIGGKQYHRTSEPSKVIGPGGKYYGLEYLNGKPQIVPYGRGAAGLAPIYQPVVDTVDAINTTSTRRKAAARKAHETRTQRAKQRFAQPGRVNVGSVNIPDFGLTEWLGIN